MKGFYVCRIIKEMKPREYKHVRECLCKIYACSQNNMKYQEQNSHIPYIQCKIEKTKNQQNIELVIKSVKIDYTHWAYHVAFVVHSCSLSLIF